MNHKNLFHLLLFLLVSQIFTQDYSKMGSDVMTCLLNDDTNTCTNVKLSSGATQCCKLTTTTYNSYGPYPSSICSIQINPISTFKEVMEAKSTKALYKEIWGYVTTVVYPASSSYNIKSKLDYSCSDGTASMSFGFDTYTSEEIKILQDENHCLSYLYRLNVENPTKQNCFDAVILQSSKDAGLSCGYYEFNIKYSDGTSENLKTCNLFNNDAFSRGQLDDKTKESFEFFVDDNQEDGKVVVSYKVALSDKNGNSVEYDSLTQSLSKSNSRIITPILKYLVFIYLLLL